MPEDYNELEQLSRDLFAIAEDLFDEAGKFREAAQAMKNMAYTRRHAMDRHDLINRVRAWVSEPMDPLIPEEGGD
jgi:hypothetical protein